MIRVFYKWSLFKEFDNLEMKNMQDITKVYNYLIEFRWLKTCVLPLLCEEPLQYTMRMNWFILQWF